MWDLQQVQGVWSTRAELQGVTCRTMACLKHCLKQQSETAGKREGSCNYSPQLTLEPVTTTESLVLNQKWRTGAFSFLGEGCNPLQLQLSFSPLMKQGLLCSLSFRLIIIISPSEERNLSLFQPRAVARFPWHGGFVGFIFGSATGLFLYWKA